MNNISYPPLVSICCITFNHAKYIQDCLNGFINQKCSFTYEILIYDDASTDGTQDIIKEYQEIYPDIIKPYFQTENQYSKGIRGMNPRFNFPRAKGKYLAMCEGDDYWTDPLKLQKQVDFLEENKDYSLCFHNTSKLVESNEVISQVDLNISEPITMNKLIKRNFIHTASVVFRNSIADLNHRIILEAPMGDYPLFILLLEKGKFKLLEDYMSVYRIHEGGVWSKLSQIENINKKIEFYVLLFNYFNNIDEYRILINNRIRELLIYKLRLNKNDDGNIELQLAHQNLELLSSKTLTKELLKRVINKVKWW